jgi:LytS/YehU family sensor histidine kinase
MRGGDPLDALIEEFISNLNLIHRLSVSENAGKTQKMVQCIDNHIRYKYLRKDEIVKLRTEMLQVDNLINIFRTRFGENLAYEKKVREDIPDPYLPSNTVLALAESALIHGLVPKEGDWRLNIEIDEHEHGLLIRVADNGVGLAPSIMDPSCSCIERKNEIAAVNARLKEYFTNPESGDMEPVSISCSGMYNKVTILLPRSGL